MSQAENPISSQNEPGRMISPSNAATTLEALRKSGITGGKDARKLQGIKKALERIEASGEASDISRLDESLVTPMGEITEAQDTQVESRPVSYEIPPWFR